MRKELKAMKLGRFVGVFSLLLLFSLCARAQQTVPHTIHDGNVSNPSNWWGGTVPYCQFAVITNNMTLDVDPGASCGGMKTWRIEGGSLNLAQNGPMTLTFAAGGTDPLGLGTGERSEEHTPQLPSLMALVFRL